MYVIYVKLIYISCQQSHENMGSEIVDHWGMTGTSAVVSCDAGSRLWVEFRGEASSRIQANDQSTIFGAVKVAEF